MIAAGLAFAPLSFAYTGDYCQGPNGAITAPDANGKCPSGYGLVNMGANGSASSNPITNLSGLIARVQDIINILIPFLIGLGVFLIIYGVFTYIAHAEDEERRKEGRTFILWGILFVFIMISVWGILSILVNSFGTSNNSSALIQNAFFNGKAPNQNNVPSLPQTPTIIDFINRVNAIGPYVLAFFVSIAVFIIIFGIVRYVREAANEEKRAEGRQFIIWGIIFVFVMLSLWGLINILVNTFSLSSNNMPVIPALPTLSS